VIIPDAGQSKEIQDIIINKFYVDGLDEKVVFNTDIKNDTYKFKIKLNLTWKNDDVKAIEPVEKQVEVQVCENFKI
jgi:hypothetical protein